MVIDRFNDLPHAVRVLLVLAGACLYVFLRKPRFIISVPESIDTKPKYPPGTPLASKSRYPFTKYYPDGSPVVLDNGCLRHEMAARAITHSKAMAAGISEKKIDAYVNEHWRETWETLEEIRYGT